MSCRAFPDRKPWHSPRATTEHMPFAGHRTQAQIRAAQEAVHRRAKDYGFEGPELPAKTASKLA